MKIAIFGLGYVGCVGMGCLAKLGHSIIGVDISDNKINMINNGYATIEENGIDVLIKEGRGNNKIEATKDSDYAVRNADVSFICVGTPNMESGHLDLTALRSVAHSIGNTLKTKDDYHVVVIRSTVTPGTNNEITELIEKVSGKKRNEAFAVVSNPEFLREGTAVEDFFSPPYTLIASDDQKAIDILKEMYKGINGEIITTNISIGEIMKLVNNSFHALKVAFGNEIGRICNKLNVDSHALMEIFCKDRILNISPYYFRPGFAYGGSCLPKDLRALNLISHDLYIDTPILKSVDKSNSEHIDFALNKVLSLNKRKISFISLTFKPGTDDLRFSPALEVAEKLIGSGYELKVYDKNLNVSKLIGKNKDFLMEKLPHIDKILVDSIDEAVDFGDVIVIPNNEKYIEEYFKNNVISEKKTIVDFTGILSDLDNSKTHVKIF